MAGNAGGVGHPFRGEVLGRAVIRHGLAGELAETAVDDAGAEVLRIEEDLLAEDVRVGGGGGDGISESGAGDEEEGGCGGEEEKRSHGRKVARMDGGARGFCGEL